jgi:arginyl-tRNA synthetase
MDIFSQIQNTVAESVKELFGIDTEASKVQVQMTLPEFTGDVTVVVFPFVKLAKMAPDQLGEALGKHLAGKMDLIAGHNVIKGFLNLELRPDFWQQFLGGLLANPTYGSKPKNGKKVMVEYSSPNTNKPLHLGHVRNCLLGWSSSKLLEAAGYEVVKVQVVNDRGVAICKSMYAWQEYGAGKTPESTGIKGDHLVGDFYVLFEQKTKEEYEAWQQSAAGKALYEAEKKEGQDAADYFKKYKNKWFNEHSVLGAAVREMLLKWEANDPEVRALWEQMNSWVYAGFDTTYEALGVAFDKLYYESNTYLLGKEIVEEGLAKKVFYKKEDGSVWVDLTDAGFDEKIVLRSDGTSVYITQDLGTAQMRYEDFGVERMVYVVADEQNYHFSVLFEVLKQLGEPYAEGLYHLSYGLVELPTGRMKTREGTVVDADDLMAEVNRIAREQAQERGGLPEVLTPEQEENIRKVGLGALKFYMIKVNPKKRMIFNPEESVELQGQTGPYIQYSYVRIHGLLLKAAKENIDRATANAYTDIQPQELALLKSLYSYPAMVEQAAESYDPSLVANFCYALAKDYHKFWHDLHVLQAETEAAKAFRVSLSQAVGQVLQSGMLLLGIEMPERM